LRRLRLILVLPFLVKERPSSKAHTVIFGLVRPS
jgi:hypothetical protein